MPARAPLAVMLAALLLVSAAPLAAASSTIQLPPLGMSVGSIAPLKDAGAAPRYGSYWAGDWMATSGWGGFDNAMKTAKNAGTTPVVYWYYWGDSISPSCFDADGCNGRNEATWTRLTDELADHLRSTLGGAEVLVVLENEFNKGGITGDFAPTFDHKLAEVAKTLDAVPGVKLVVGFGAWGENSWAKFPKTIAASDYVGFQMMRASTKDTEASYRAAADRTAYLTGFIADKFQKPSFLYDVALSSYPDDRWAKIQAETLDAIFKKLVAGGSTGLQGVVYRSLNDHYMSPSNYYGYAESHWGLRTKDGTPKPAFDVWIAHARGAASAPPAPAAPNVPGSFEAESMSATKGGRKNDASASGGAAWNLWSNGELATDLVTEGAMNARISVVALGQTAAGVSPRMEVRLDGATIGTFDVAPGAYREYAVDASLPAGSSRLAIAFTNDAIVNGEDRNLIVDVVRVAAAKANTPPVAAFDARADGLQAFFDASASSDGDGDALAYAWSFGDGNTGSGTTVAHSYAAEGEYAVTLTVSDGKDASSATRSLKVVRPNAAPTADFTWTASHLVVSFDARLSSDADGDALAYAWSFGDGAKAEGATPRHEYAAPGTYTVRLSVSDGRETAERVLSVTVTYPAPVAKASASGSGKTRELDGSASHHPAGGEIRHHWALGDGRTAEGAKVTHTYAPGRYTATLTVTDRFGQTATDTVAIEVARDPYTATFAPRNGNDWWVQVKLDANAPTVAVCVSINGGACQPLTLKSWGDWAASMRVPRDASVTYTATSDTGERVTSQAYAGSSPNAYVPPFSATFTPHHGNNWWVQSRVEANRPVASVCASVDGGACKPLELKPWGSWASSFYVRTGAKVTFVATSADGAKVSSAAYTWPVK